MSEFGGLWKHEKTQRALYNSFGLGSATLLQLAFLGEGDPNFHGRNSHWDNKVYKIQNTKDTPFHTKLWFQRRRPSKNGKLYDPIRTEELNTANQVQIER